MLVVLLLHPKIGQALSDQSSKSALDGADALVIVTEWQAFRSPDFAALKSLPKAPLIFDGRKQA